jgi:hypothetical protein
MRKYYPSISFERQGKTMNISQDRQTPGREVSSEPSEYLTGGANYPKVIFDSNYIVCTPYYVTLIW